MSPSHTSINKNNTEFVCVDERRRLELSITTRHSWPLPTTWVNLPNKFLTSCDFFVIFGSMKSISPVWLMPWVFLPRTAKSGKLLIIWKYQWEWRSLSRCGSVAVAFANETCSCWDRKPCSLGLGTPRWQGDNCYCKLLLAMHEERVSVPVLPPLIWS